MTSRFSVLASVALLAACSPGPVGETVDAATTVKAPAVAASPAPALLSPTA